MSSPGALPKPWRTLACRRVFAGGPIREISIDTVELPDGRIVSNYYQIRLPDYVLIFAELSDGTVPMLWQYKHGVGRVCLTFPGGAIEPDELPLAAAQRELREELGCVADDWESLGAFVTNGNQGCNTAHLYRARNVRKVQEPFSDDLEDSVLEYLDVTALRAPQRIEEIGQATHVALLLLATAV
jgi:ADP-ribose pyrophosphatase